MGRMIERKACLIEQTFKVKRRFLAERQMLRCNMIVSNKFSGCRELAFIYPYFELYLQSRNGVRWLNSILFCISSTNARDGQSYKTQFSRSDSFQRPKKKSKKFPPFSFHSNLFSKFH